MKLLSSIHWSVHQGLSCRIPECVCVVDKNPSKLLPTWGLETHESDRWWAKPVSEVCAVCKTSTKESWVCATKVPTFGQSSVLLFQLKFSLPYSLLWIWISSSASSFWKGLKKWDFFFFSGSECDLNELQLHWDNFKNKTGPVGQSVKVT